MEPHFHLYAAPAGGPIRTLSTRAGDVWADRNAAKAWAARQRPAERRIIRQCRGGEACPGNTPPAERVALPAAPRPRRRRPARLLRLRRALDGLDAEQLARLEALLQDL